MAQGQKRTAGRPPKTASKRVKISESPVPSSPAVATPAPPTEAQLLPFRISDHRPLPTLSELQEDCLSSEEYQSIASSAVLLASLERSRARWTQAGIFERYWTKPETGKNARPPPPNNPDVKWMKAKGPCRIRIEPHIFEAEMYVEEKEKVKPVKYMPPPQPYGQPYQQRPFQAVQPQQRPQPYSNSNAASPAPQQSYQPPAQQSPAPVQPPSQQQSPATVQPSNATQQSPAPAQQSPAPPSQNQTAAPAQAPAKPKSQPDPVISLLAARASSDPALKVLMKEVATGKASQQQLQTFQRHIDDLTKLLQEKEKTKPAAPPVPAQPRPYQAPQQQYQQPTYRPQQQWQPPPPPAALPVILQFLTLGSTEDRFLFPQNSIIEKLTQQHLLVSCIVTRRCEGKEVWQPVTFMVEVAYGREELLNCVHRWVKPVDRVQAHMKEIMARCTRAPNKHLAFRLPQKAFAAEEPEPAVSQFVAEEKPKKARSNVVFVKTKKKEAEPEKDKENAKVPEKAKIEEKVEKQPEKGTESVTDGRPRRSVRGN